MSVTSQIDRIQANIEDCYEACEERGARMPTVENSNNLPPTIYSIKKLSPTYAYTGVYQHAYDEDGDWMIYLLSSGTLTFTASTEDTFDAFLVGGGGSGVTGNYYQAGAGGGGGGYTQTYTDIPLTLNDAYTAVVGAGGSNSDIYNGADGGSTSFSYGSTTYTVNGGTHGEQNRTAGLPNGGEGGYSTTPGEDGGDGAYAFGSSDYAQYGGGGGGGAGYKSVTVSSTTQITAAYLISLGYPASTANRIVATYAANGWSTDVTSSSSVSVYSTGGAGGAGGGGDGAGVDLSVAGSGEANTGGGGGGACLGGGKTTPGAGGSGVVIIRKHK